MAYKQSGSRRTIAVDFDGVIADYDGWKGRGVLGEPRADVKEALATLHAEGWKIVIHTTRGQEEIRNYLMEHRIAYDEINGNSDYKTQGPKPVADVYWDDRAVRYSGDARKDLEAIRQFKTWSGRE
jgi:hydroxymethylpyrimidine pyrophosphatase-like HAD family hydrolase